MKNGFRILIGILVTIVSLIIVFLPGIVSYHNSQEHLANDTYEYSIAFSELYSEKSITKKLVLPTETPLRVFFDGRVMFGKLNFWVENEAGNTIFFETGKQLSFNNIIEVDSKTVTVHIELYRASIVLLAAGINLE